MSHTLNRWLDEEALTFPLRDPEMVFDAADRMLDALPEATRLLGWGQPLYHGQEFLTLRNLVFQRFVTHHQFSAIALEAGFAIAREVDDFVKGASRADAHAVLARACGGAFGDHQANLDLLLWMRDHNQRVEARRQVSFHGFAIPEFGALRQTLQFVLDRLELLERPSVRAQRERCDKLWEDLEGGGDPNSVQGRTMQLRIETDEMLSELERNRPRLWDQDRVGYLQALQHAAVARCLLQLEALRSRAGGEQEATELRDAMLGDILKNVTEQEQGRVLAVGHHSHFRTSASDEVGHGSWPAGAHLRRHLDTAFTPVGAGVGSSLAFSIDRPEEATVEAALMQLRSPAFLMVSRPVKVLAKVGLPVRSAPTDGSGYKPLTAGALQDFEAILFLPQVSRAVEVQKA